MNDPTSEKAKEYAKANYSKEDWKPIIKAFTDGYTSCQSDTSALKEENDRLRKALEHVNKRCFLSYPDNIVVEKALTPINSLLIK